MKAKDYWADRAERVIIAGERRGGGLIKSVTEFYAEAERDILTQIDAFYGRYAKENGVTLMEAGKLLDKPGLKGFQAEMEKYLAEANRLRLGNAYKNRLRTLSTRAAISRYQAPLAQVRHRIEVLTAKGESAFSETLEEVYTESYYQTIFDIQHGLDFGVDFARMDTATVERLLRTPWLEGNYSSRLWNNRTLLVQQLEQIIPQAFSIGYNSRVLGRKISERLNVSKHAGNGWPGLRSTTPPTSPRGWHTGLRAWRSTNTSPHLTGAPAKSAGRWTARCSVRLRLSRG